MAIECSWGNSEVTRRSLREGIAVSVRLAGMSDAGPPSKCSDERERGVSIGITGELVTFGERTVPFRLFPGLVESHLRCVRKAKEIELFAAQLSPDAAEEQWKELAWHSSPTSRNGSPRASPVLRPSL